MCSLGYTCQQVWAALCLGGMLGIGAMGLIFGPLVRRLEGERNHFKGQSHYWEDECREALKELSGTAGAETEMSARVGRLIDRHA